MRFGLEQAFDVAAEHDSCDLLSRFRDQFCLPNGKIYLLGNSLGLMPKQARGFVSRVLDEWSLLGIDGWLAAEQPWFHYAEKLGARMAPLVGSHPDEVICTGGTSANIHSLVAAFFKPVGRKNKILADELNFPSDIYALKGQLKLRGLDPERHLVLVPSRNGQTLLMEDIVDHMSADVALAFFPSVLFRSGQLLDMQALTQKAHANDILIGFDLCHSAGALPHALSDWGVDFATWCSYKYLNAGPGGPAFLYVHRRHFGKESLLCGWFGCEKSIQFDLSLHFRQQLTAGGFQVSTPPVLSMAALDAAVGITQQAGIDNIRAKSLAMTSFFIDLVQEHLPLATYGFNITTPKEPGNRGGHVTLRHPTHAWPICCALKNRGVVVDFRPPSALRFAPVALYNTFYELAQVVMHLREIVDRRDHERSAPPKSPVP